MVDKADKADKTDKAVRVMSTEDEAVAKTSHEQRVFINC